MISEQRSEGRLQAAKEHFVDALSSQNLHEVEAQFRYTIKGSTKWPNTIQCPNFWP